MFTHAIYDEVLFTDRNRQRKFRRNGIAQEARATQFENNCLR